MTMLFLSYYGVLLFSSVFPPALLVFILFVFVLVHVALLFSIDTCITSIRHYLCRLVVWLDTDGALSCENYNPSICLPDLKGFCLVTGTMVMGTCEA